MACGVMARVTVTVGVAALAVASTPFTCVLVKLVVVAVYWVRVVLPVATWEHAEEISYGGHPLTIEGGGT
jgi:hypothetical protein